VLIAEPPRTQADIHFSLFGIPVRVHPFFWLVTLLLGARPENSFDAVMLWIVAVFISIVIHELGHAATARAFGWNSQIVLYSFGGLAVYQPTYDDPKKQIAVMLAGPLAGFLFAATLAALLVACGVPVAFQLGGSLGIDWLLGLENPKLLTLVHYLFLVNIFWGLINLLPVYPLDGGQIAREILNARRPGRGLLQSLWVSTVTGAVTAVVALVALRGDGFLMALMFGYFAYTSYSLLQQYNRGGGYGDYGEYGGDRW